MVVVVAVLIERHMRLTSSLSPLLREKLPLLTDCIEVVDRMADTDPTELDMLMAGVIGVEEAPSGKVLLFLLLLCRLRL